MPPYQTGGDMIEFVGDERTTWNALPRKFEAGTPNVGAAVGLAAAISYLNGIGMDVLRRHEQTLTAAAMTRLASLPGVRVYGPPAADRSGVVSFTVQDIHPHDVATVLDGEHICVRAGHHCAQPLMRRFGIPATVRASFFVYNDAGDVDALVAALGRTQALFATEPPTAPHASAAAERT
jgi:cysteine desulfurase/selenocysteine lyase